MISFLSLSPDFRSPNFDKPPRKMNCPFCTVFGRFLDIIVSLAAILIFTPLWILVAIAIYVEDAGNPIFVDTRLGKDRKMIKFFKFRSMFHNASELERKNKKVYKQLRSGEHKVKDHPYVTKVGRFIRKYSIDEMLQFFNVLAGDMSVVGPRALKVDEEDKFRRENKHLGKHLDMLFEVKPGITGYWQVSGRSNIDFETRIKMEAYYARVKDVINDILIMLETPLAVIRAETH